MQTDKILRGEKVILRPLTEADVPLLRRWFFDPDILRWLQLSEDPPALRTLEAVRARFSIMDQDPSTQVWRVDTLEGEPIGQIELVSIHRLHGRAEMHMVIGEKAYWNGGFGTDALRRLLRYAFEELHLRRVYLTPDADNTRAIRTFEKAGFMREGILRQHRLRYGQPVSMVMMAVLQEDFR